MIGVVISLQTLTFLYHILWYTKLHNLANSKDIIVFQNVIIMSIWQYSNIYIYIINENLKLNGCLLSHGFSIWIIIIYSFTYDKNNIIHLYREENNIVRSMFFKNIVLTFWSSLLMNNDF